MVILQWGLVVVCDGEVMLRFAQKVVVQATMLVVMHCCRPDGGPVLQFTHGSTLEDSSMA